MPRRERSAINSAEINRNELIARPADRNMRARALFHVVSLVSSRAGLNGAGRSLALTAYGILA